MPRGIPALAKLIEPKAFGKVHLGEWGHGIEWVAAELGADNVYAWAKDFEYGGRGAGHQPADGELLSHGAEGYSTGDLAGVPGLGGDEAEGEDAAAGAADGEGVCVVARVSGISGWRCQL